MENLRPSPQYSGSQTHPVILLTPPSAQAPEEQTEEEGENQLNSGLISEWVPRSCPLTRQGRTTSPWKQSSRDKCHTPVLSRVERGVQGRWRWKIHHLAYHPGKPICTEEKNQCETGAAFPLPTSLYLSNMRGTSDRLEWAVSWLQALSCTPRLHPSPWPPHINLSIHVYTCAHMQAHTERPVQFPCRTGRRWRRKGRQ